MALARAFMRKSDVLILDEPTASIDAEGEREAIERFRALRHNRTAVLITHRFGAVRMADRNRGAQRRSRGRQNHSSHRRRRTLRANVQPPGCGLPRHSHVVCARLTFPQAFARRSLDNRA